MAGQPQSYGSIREFLDNLPNQPCIWLPENTNICVTCLRINEPVARVCSVWAQALEEAPLEEIDFEEEVRSLPSVVEVEDEFEMVEIPTLSATPNIAEVDIVETSTDWNMSMEPAVAIEPTEEIAETVIETATDATEEIVDEVIAEPVAVEPTEEIVEAVVTEPIIAEPVAVEPTEEIVEAVVTEPIATEATEEIALDTIQDAVEAENIAKENLESAAEIEEMTAEAVVEAVTTETEAVEAYAEAVKDEDQAAEAVVEAVEAENMATEAVVEAADQVAELVESDAEENEIQEAVSELKESVEKQEEAEEVLAEAVATEEVAAEDVESTSVKEEEAAAELDKAILAEEEAGDKLEEAIAQEEQAEDEVKETIEVAKEIETNESEDSVPTEAPFTIGEEVSHGVHGEGKVLNLYKAGKHWSVEVDFSGGKKSILGTFLTPKKVQNISEETNKESFKKPESKEIKEKIIPIIENPEENEEEIATIVADIVETDHGDYEPGVNVIHDIFGTGKIIDSKPKGENYRLEIEFEDETTRNLLSTFVKLSPDEAAETVVAETVIAEPTEEIAETVVAETTVLDTDIVYKRPEKKKEPVIDLSKPEVQDAEMVDNED